MSKTELTLTCEPHVMESIDGMQKRLKLQSTSQVFAIALALLDHIDNEVRYRKASVIVRYPDGMEGELPWPPPAVKVDTSKSR